MKQTDSYQTSVDVAGEAADVLDGQISVIAKDFRDGILEDGRAYGWDWDDVVGYLDDEGQKALNEYARLRLSGQPWLKASLRLNQAIDRAIVEIAPLIHKELYS